MSSRKQISASKLWCGTLNNWTPSEYEVLVVRMKTYKKRFVDFEYVIGKEVGENGTPHLQLCIKRDKRFRPLPTFLIGNGRIHFERCRGNWMQNVQYCTKDGDYVASFDAKTYMYRHMSIDDLEQTVHRLDDASRVSSTTSAWPPVEQWHVRSDEHDEWAKAYEVYARRMTC